MNVQAETHIGNDEWLRLQTAMKHINEQRHIIRKAEDIIRIETREIGFLLWPRTDPRWNT